MGIEINNKKPPLGAALYEAIREEATALSFGDRMALFGAMRNGTPFRALEPKLQQAFERCGARLRRSGHVASE